MVYNDTQKMNVFGEIIVYLLSIVVPIGVILITKATGNISEIINTNIVRICLCPVLTPGYCQLILFSPSST